MSHTRKTPRGTMRGVSSPTVQPEPSGKRLAALREALDGMTQQQVADQSVVLWQRDPTRYQRIGRSHLGNQEVAEVAQKDTLRVTLAAIFGISTDDLRSYLDGELDLEDVMEIRRQRAEGEGPASGVAEPGGGPRLKTHSRWADLCMQAMAIAPEIRPDTLRDLGDKPFPYAKDVEAVDAYLLVDMARGLQSWRRRAP